MENAVKVALCDKTTVGSIRPKSDDALKFVSERNSRDGGVLIVAEYFSLLPGYQLFGPVMERLHRLVEQSPQVSELALGR
jgi:hypothetical protein